MTAFDIKLTDDAAQDLEELYDYISHHDAPAKADHVLGRIEEVLEGLRHSPDRGSFPAELLALGIKQYREVFFKPYRVIYQVLDNIVYVMLIVDGRRDLRALLQRRLLRER